MLVMVGMQVVFPWELMVGPIMEAMQQEDMEAKLKAVLPRILVSLLTEVVNQLGTNQDTLQVLKPEAAMVATWHYP